MPDNPLYPDDLRMVEVFQLLAKNHEQLALEDLIGLARKKGHAEIVRILEKYQGEPVPLFLVIQAVRVEVELNAHRTWSELCRTLTGLRVGLLPPLPIHVLQRLSPYATDLLLPVGDEHLPHEIQLLACDHHEGFRACRQAAAACDAIVFEAYREGISYSVQPEILEVLEAVVSGPPDRPRLLIRPRPLSVPGDVPLRLDAPGTII